jgi:hypothetical protein
MAAIRQVGGKPIRSPTLRSRRVSRTASRLFAASLFLALCLAGTVRAAEEADRSTLEDYVISANRALKSLPDGVQLLEPLAQRLVELTADARRVPALSRLRPIRSYFRRRGLTHSTCWSEAMSTT